MENPLNDKKIHPYIKIGIIIAICIVLYIIIKKGWDKYQKDKLQKKLEESIATTTIQGAGGVQVPVSVNLGTKAQAIYNAFHNNDWFGWSENEEQAKAELLDVPKNLIPNLSAVYYASYGENLKNDFQQYCGDEWPSISYLFS